MCMRGVGGLELSFNSILPSLDPFGDWEDDASSINLPRVINWLAEMGESWQLHPSRHVASNILYCLSIVMLVVLLGVLDQNYLWCNLRYCSKQLECEHLFRNVPQELLHLLSDVTQKFVTQPSTDKHDGINRYPSKIHFHCCSYPKGVRPHLAWLKAKACTSDCLACCAERQQYLHWCNLGEYSMAPNRTDRCIACCVWVAPNSVYQSGIL